MRLRIISLLIISLVTAGLTVTAGGSAIAAPSPRGSVVSDAFFPSGDGTLLHAEVALPKNGCAEIVNADGSRGCPTIVSMGPYFGSGVQNGIALGFGDITNDANFSNRFFDFFAYNFQSKGGQNIFEMGYAVVQVDSRGYGESGGCNDYGGVGEQMDMAAAVTWAGSQDWSNGNVGTWGKSYDAWTQVMGLAENPPHLEAAIIQAPIIDGYGIAYTNGVHHDSGWYITTNLYALYDYSPNSIHATPQGHINYATGMTGVSPNNNGVGTPACWAQQNAEVLNPDRDWYFWQERDLRPRASRNDDVAVFFTHGFTDVNTKADQIFGVYDGLTRNNPENTRAWFGQWNHVRGSDAIRNSDLEDQFPHEDWVVGRAGWNEEALDWLNHYLRGEDFVYEVNDKNLVEAQDQQGNWRTEAQYPSTDVRRMDMPIAAGTYSDTMSSNGFWSLSPVVTDEFRITGESTVTIDVTTTAPFAQFIGVLYDVDESGRGSEIGRSAYRIPGSGTYSFNTQPGDYLIAEGHKLGFEIKSTHAEAQPYPTGQTVTINGGSVTMPIPEFDRVLNLGGQQTTAMSQFYDTVSGTVKNVEMDMGALGSRPYTQADAAAGIPHPQGDLDATRPFN